jgi:hypothetical protein
MGIHPIATPVTNIDRLIFEDDILILEFTRDDRIQICVNIKLVGGISTFLTLKHILLLCIPFFEKTDAA